MAVRYLPQYGLFLSTVSMSYHQHYCRVIETDSALQGQVLPS